MQSARADASRKNGDYPEVIREVEEALQFWPECKQAMDLKNAARAIPSFAWKAYQLRGSGNYKAAIKSLEEQKWGMPEAEKFQQVLAGLQEESIILIRLHDLLEEWRKMSPAEAIPRLSYDNEQVQEYLQKLQERNQPKSQYILDFIDENTQRWRSCLKK